MTKKWLSIGLILIIFTIYNSSSQTKLNIATVNIETIIKEMPAAIKADEEIKTLGQKFYDTLNLLQEDLQKKFQNYQKQKGMMSQQQQVEEEEQLQAMQMNLMQYQEEKLGQTGELSRLRERLLEPIRIQVRSAIETIANDENFTLVLDVGSAAVLYSEDSLDITFRVLDKIKRGKK